MTKSKRTKIKLQGYDIYISEKNKSKKSLAYISKVKAEIDNKYSKIEDINELYTLLKKAKQKVFLKEEISFGLVLGLIGFGVSYLIENMFGEHIEELTFSYRDLIYVIVVTLILSISLCVFLILIMGRIAESYKNPYRLFVLPYEIEVLESRITEIEKSNNTIERI